MMFDTMTIAKRIKSARIEKNMTQLQLADVMGVSYQAVSNWERGNSMPDISKLGDLCSALGLTVNELLGMEEKTVSAVTKAMEQEELTVEELKEVAPMLPPEQVKEQVESKWNIPMPDLSFLKDLPEKISHMRENAAEIKKAAATIRESFDEETVEKLKAKGIKVTVTTKKEGQTEQKKSEKSKKKVNLSAIAELAPFLDEEYLNSLVENADLSDLDGLDDLAPFLSKETLSNIAERASLDDLETIAEIAPFLNKATVEKLVIRCAEAKEFYILEELAPFVSKEALDRLAENVQPENLWEVASIAPFFSQETLDKLVRRCEDAGDYDALEELAPFLSKDVTDGLIDRYIEKKCDEDLSDIYPFLSREAMRKLAVYLLERGQTDALDDVQDYL